MNKRVPPLITVLAFVFAIIFFFPIFWMVLISFKQEVDVVNISLIFKPTIRHYSEIFQGNIRHFIANSVIVTLTSIFFALILGIPVAYVLVVGKPKKGENLFFWFISTILLPPVCVIIPVYLVFKILGMLDTRLGLVVVYTGVHIPIVVWMMRSFFSDIPFQLVESARIDGSTELSIFFKIMLPISRNGIWATILLIFIFIWNEFFFALSLTYTKAATLPIFVSSFMTQEGLFWAKMCAVSTVAALPPILLGWLNQKQLTRGLTMGAVKG